VAKPRWLGASAILLFVSTAGIVAGAVLNWVLDEPDAANAVWGVVTAIGLIPIAWEVGAGILRREAGVDLIAVLAMAGALALAAVSGSLNWKKFGASVVGATRTSCMIAFILAGAAFLTVAMGFTGVPRILAKWIGDQGFSAWQLIAVLTVLFVILGCFIDGISMVVLTSSVILPSVKAAGIDLLWFGIFVVLVVEMAQITPPVGFNLFVLQAMAKRDPNYVARAAIPFFFMMLLAILFLCAFPWLATWLPDAILGATRK